MEIVCLNIVRHYREEFVFVDLSIAIKVKFVDHGLPAHNMNTMSHQHKIDILQFIVV